MPASLVPRAHPPQALVAELRVKHYKRTPGFLAVCGAFALGGAANTGIVVGTIAVAMGAIQILLYVIGGHSKGDVTASCHVIEFH